VARRQPGAVTRLRPGIIGHFVRCRAKREGLNRCRLRASLERNASRHKWRADRLPHFRFSSVRHDGHTYHQTVKTASPYATDLMDRARNPSRRCLPQTRILWQEVVKLSQTAGAEARWPREYRAHRFLNFGEPRGHFFLTAALAVQVISTRRRMRA